MTEKQVAHDERRHGGQRYEEYRKAGKQQIVRPPAGVVDDMVEEYVESPEDGVAALRRPRSLVHRERDLLAAGRLTESGNYDLQFSVLDQRTHLAVSHQSPGAEAARQKVATNGVAVSVVGIPG